MANVMEYKCPCCGGIVEFDSQSQQMKCPYCNTVFTVSQMQEKDDILDDALGQSQSAPASGEMGVYTCKSCGGELVADQNTAATHCPFCGNPVMLTGRLSGEWKPDLVIPFVKSKQEAKDALRAFTVGKKLVPKFFLSESHLDEIKGVYVPFWLYDAQADIRGSFDGELHRSYRIGEWQYTEVKHFDVHRAGTLAFENVPVDGSEKMPADIMESIEPYDYSALKPFQTAYLSGYMADKYDVDAQKSEARANERMTASAESALLDSVSNYDHVNPMGRDIKLRTAKPKYALMPVWLLTATWKDQQYRFAMNGQTGKFVGSLPVDKKAVRRWWLIYSGAISTVLWLLLHFAFKL